MNFHQWLHYGIEAGYCTDAVCSTHDGLPLSEQEQEEAIEFGLDDCIPAVRLLGPEQGDPTLLEQPHQKTH